MFYVEYYEKICGYHFLFCLFNQKFKNAQHKGIRMVVIQILKAMEKYTKGNVNVS